MQKDAPVIYVLRFSFTSTEKILQQKSDIYL